MEIEIEGYKILIDAEHKERISLYKWYAIKNKSGSISFKGYIQGVKKNYKMFSIQAVITGKIGSKIKRVGEKEPFDYRANNLITIKKRKQIDQTGMFYDDTNKTYCGYYPICGTKFYLCASTDMDLAIELYKEKAKLFKKFINQRKFKLEWALFRKNNL